MPEGAGSMAVLTIQVPIEVGFLVGQNEALGLASQAAEAAATQVMEDAGGNVALKLRQSGAYNFRNQLEIDLSTGNGTLTWIVTVGAIDYTDAVGGDAEIGALVENMRDALQAVADDHDTWDTQTHKMFVAFG